MSTLIRLEHLSAEVRLPDGERLTTVDDVSASFERGTSTAIIGKSGSGKTSLASIIGLLNNDYDGTLSYDGRDCAAWNDADRARFRCRHVGFVFQNYSLIPHLSAWENVALPLQYRGGIPCGSSEDEPRACCTPSGSGAGRCAACRRACREANSSAWPSPERWWAIPIC